ncbi:hypothetical protein NKDENANG_00936 [Candidatus Entotheonellaceae bacterium PAL068K]
MLTLSIAMNRPPCCSSNAGESLSKSFWPFAASSWVSGCLWTCCITHPFLVTLSASRGNSTGILAPTLPEHNLENTSKASLYRPPAAAAHWRQWRLPRHTAAACRSGAQQGVGRSGISDSGWVTVEPQGFLRVKASGQFWDRQEGRISNGMSQTRRSDIHRNLAQY